MNWPAMIQAAARMGVAPEAFWRLSLKEWRMLTQVVGRAAPMGREGLEAMMGTWPDER
jgi:uncharacterized phage protein (TIGR02216 family)